MEDTEGPYHPGAQALQSLGVTPPPPIRTPLGVYNFFIFVLEETVEGRAREVREEISTL